MPRISRKDSQKLTRRLLRESARCEFATHGIAASSIDRITDAAEFTRGAFYSNYASKAELALDIYSESRLEEVSLWEELIEAAATPEALSVNIERHFDETSTRRDVWLLGLELRLQAERDPKFRMLYEASNVELRGHVRAMLRNLCRATGSDDADVDYLTLVLHSFIQGLHFERSNSLGVDMSPGQIVMRLLDDLLGTVNRRISTSPTPLKETPNE